MDDVRIVRELVADVRLEAGSRNVAELLGQIRAVSGGEGWQNMLSVQRKCELRAAALQRRVGARQGAWEARVGGDAGAGAAPPEREREGAHPVKPRHGSVARTLQSRYKRTSVQHCMLLFQYSL